MKYNSRCTCRRSSMKVRVSCGRVGPSFHGCRIVGGAPPPDERGRTGGSVWLAPRRVRPSVAVSGLMVGEGDGRPASSIRRA